MSEHSTDANPIQLSPTEARVLGSLMEKQHTTPDYYPLTLNALVTACNQKSSRLPVMRLTPGEVGHCLNQLRDRDLVRSDRSGRAERYEQKLSRALRLDRRQTAIVTLLTLRGPQTSGEIRINTARMAEFDNLNQLHEDLEELMTRTPALVARLPKTPGQREERYAHLLCGPPDLEHYSQTTDVSASEIQPHNDRIATLEAEVARLREDLDQLWQRIGRRPEPAGKED